MSDDLARHLRELAMVAEHDDDEGWLIDATARIEALEAEVAEWERDYPNLVAAACAFAVTRAEDERLHPAAPSEPQP